MCVCVCTPAICFLRAWLGTKCLYGKSSLVWGEVLWSRSHRSIAARSYLWEGRNKEGRKDKITWQLFGLKLKLLLKLVLLVSLVRLISLLLHQLVLRNLYADRGDIVRHPAVVGVPPLLPSGPL